MHDGIEVLIGKQTLKQTAVTHIACNQRTPAHRGGVAAAEVVQRGHGAAGLRQPLEHVRADIAGPAHDQNVWLVFEWLERHLEARLVQKET